MSLYLLTAVPIAYALMIVSSGAADGPESFSTVVRPLLRGIVVWIIGYLIYLFISALVPLRFTASGLYWYYAFHDFGYWTVVGIVGYLVTGLLRSDTFERDGLAGAGSFMLGVFVLQPVIDLIEFHKSLNVYYLFLLPTLRIVLVYVFASLVATFRDFRAPLRAASFAGVIATALILAFVPMLYLLRHPAASWLLCLVLAAGAASLYLYSLHGERSA